MKRAHQKQGRASHRGFALVITLIMVVLAAVITVALLSNASTDRGTAAAFTTRYQTELACQCALEAAKKALQATALVSGIPTSRTQNDDFLIVSVNDSNGVPYYFAGSCQDPTNSGNSNYANPGIQYFPLFSGGTTQSGLTVAGGAAPNPNPTLGTGTQAQQTFGTTTVNYPSLFTTPPYSTWQKKLATNWQTVALSGTTQEYRYTYWIEDLAGYADAKVAGNIDGAGSTNLRSLGYDPKEEGLFTLFSTSSQADPGSTYASTFLVPNHPVLNTRLSTRLGTTAGSTDDTACLTSLAANLQSDSEQSIIPHGLGYKNEGQAKTNLNTIIAKSPNDTGVTTVVKAISDNLPTFASARQGGLDSSQGYSETLAANIIDYADTDSNPLVGTNGTSGKNYRGIDLMPFVVEVYEMYTWTGFYALAAPNDYNIQVQINTYAQVWNMFSKDITTGSLVFSDTNKAGIQFGSGGISSFDQAKSVSDSNIKIDFSANPLKANEYRPYLACQRLYTFDTGTTNTGSLRIGNKGTPTQFDKQSTYSVAWNGVVYDRPGIVNGSNADNIERNSFTLTKQGDIQIVGTLPGLRYTNASGAPYNLGDPRASYYIQKAQYDNSYGGATGNSAWGGQIYMKTLVEKSGSDWYAGETRVAGWADGGHNFTRGTLPSTATTVPTTIPEQTADSTKAPARISNAGQLHSITELSYIYDPFQWNPFASAPGTTTAVDTTWHSTWKTAFKAADGTYGSHSTLRIGRPEHKTFDQPGTRAWQLLDIFSAGDPIGSGTSSQISTLGKININTASEETLRVLGAGIQIGNLNSADVDQAIQPTTVYGPQTTNAADIFASDVIAQRQSYPFLSTSQLAALAGSNGEPFFGNTDQWPSNPPTEWNDAASEEYFGKLFNFATVRSRNFRVFVTGQLYDTTSKQVVATANKVYEVYLKPTRDPGSVPPGNVTGQTCQVTYAANLPQ